MPEPQSLPTLTAYFYGSFGVEGFLVQGLGSGHNQRSSHVAESQTETPKIQACVIITRLAPSIPVPKPEVHPQR